MTVLLAPSPVFKAFDNNGAPLFNGQLFTYIAGSSTPQATYVDSTQTTPNSNPVILNARGEANVWLIAGTTYKLVLQDSLGNQIWSIDQVSGGFVLTAAAVLALLTQANLGAILYPMTAAEASASVTPSNFGYPAGDPRRYGALGDGSTDDTVALANCFKVNQPINFPGSAFSFVISSTVSLSNNQQVVNGNGSTIKVSASMTNVANVSTLISVLNANDVIIQGLTFDATLYAGASVQNWGIVYQGTVGGVTNRGRVLNCHFLNLPQLGSGIAFFVGGVGHIARGNTFTTCHGAVFSQASHSIQDNNIAYNPLDTSFVIHAPGNVGSSIVNNKVENPLGNAQNSIGIEEGPSEWTITGNHIFGLTGSGIYCLNSAYLAQSQGGVIANNIIDGGNGTVAPIGIVNGIAMTGYYANCDIHDNQIYNLPSSASGSSALVILYAIGTKFHDNYMDQTSFPGLSGCTVINPGPGTASASQTVANPGVFTTATQGWKKGQTVIITGTAPGGFSNNTVYYVIATGLTSTSVELSATPTGAGIQVTSSSACTLQAVGPIDMDHNKTVNYGGNRGYFVAAGNYGSQRLCWEQEEILGGSNGIDANTSANSGADLWIVNTKANTATTPLAAATNYTVLADFQTFYNAAAWQFPHSIKTLAYTVMFGNSLPATTSGVQNSTVFQLVPAVGGHVSYVKTGAALWTASAAVF